jgi:hypothetical protein
MAGEGWEFIYLACTVLLARRSAVHVSNQTRVSVHSSDLIWHRRSGVRIGAVASLALHIVSGVSSAEFAQLSPCGFTKLNPLSTYERRCMQS